MLSTPGDAEVSLVSRVDIWVLGFDPGFPESPSDGLRRVFGLETQEALTLELTVPTPVKRVDPADAKRWLAALRSVGAEVEERPVEAGTPPAFDLPEPRVETPSGAGDIMPPGVVMPTGTAEAKAKAKAEIEALSSKKQKANPPKQKGSGAVKEEVHRVIRTPSMPQDRRPPPQRKASTPALLLDPDEMARAEGATSDEVAPAADGGGLDPFGELDMGEVEAKAAERKEQELAEAAERKGGALELELADVQPRRRPEAETAAATPDAPVTPTVEGPSKARDIAIGAGALVVGLVALYVGVIRFESPLLGTGSFATWAIDAVGFGGVLYGLLHLGLTFGGREPELAGVPIIGALIVGYGIAYGVATVQAPSADALATLQSGGGDTVAIREILNDPKARLADSTPEEAEAIVDAALEGGAVNVQAGHRTSVLGRTVAHVLIIELPATGGARAHMAALVRRALGADRATLAADVPSSDHWAVPLR
jgi:hypothetical protein